MDLNANDKKREIAPTISPKNIFQYFLNLTILQTYEKKQTFRGIVL